MKKRIAIIPARGGSKRIPKKNIRNFCGKPMISYILQTAKSSNLFNIIHVSTEDHEILSVVSDLGFHPDFIRDSDLADDKTPIMPVLKSVVEKYYAIGERFDEVWLLMPCAPLIEPSDLENAAKLFNKNAGQQTVLAITEYPVPIEWAFDRDEKNRLYPVMTGMFANPSSELKSKYHDTGTFAIFSSGYVLSSKGPGSDQNNIGYVLPKTKGIDIDTEEDWRIAEAIFQLNKAPL